MRLTEGTPNVMQRLARLPAAPHLTPLLNGKPVPFSLCHKHHPFEIEFISDGVAQTS
jgi:hypothetical protein